MIVEKDLYNSFEDFKKDLIKVRRDDQRSWGLFFLCYTFNEVVVPFCQFDLFL